MTYRQRKQRKHRRQVALVIFGLVALAIGGGYLNWVAYSAWVCQEVPNHYSCQEAK